MRPNEPKQQVKMVTHIPEYLMFLCFTALCLLTVNDSLYRSAGRQADTEMGEMLMVIKATEAKRQFL